MEESTTLARPYAVAAFRYAKESGKTEEWANTLSFLAGVMADGRMQQASRNPRISRDRFTKLFMGLCEGYVGAGSGAENYVRLLIQNQRLNLLGEIAAQFAKYRAEDEGYVDVAVMTAYDLTEDELKKLAQTLESELARKPVITVTVDERLIGGLVVRAGDRVIDASVRGQIERLAKSLMN